VIRASPSTDVPLWIGMPVYNGAKTIAKSVEALLGQSCGEFILFISDNASTDGTSAILRAYAARDRRIRYVRQPRNRGASWNFQFVLRQADRPFFMWAAADDYWDAHFVRDNLARLRADPRTVLSASRTAFVAKDQALLPAADTYPLAGPIPANVCGYVADPGTNSRFYGIFRRPVIVHACRRALGHFLASDWAVMAHTLRFGHHAEVGELQFFRHTGGASSEYGKLIALFRREPLDFFFPMARFTFAVLRIGREARSLRLHLLLLRHNLQHSFSWLTPLFRFLPAAPKLWLKHLLGVHSRSRRP
jgi:hypothetical protein